MKIRWRAFYRRHTRLCRIVEFLVFREWWLARYLDHISTLSGSSLLEQKLWWPLCQNVSPCSRIACSVCAKFDIDSGLLYGVWLPYHTANLWGLEGENVYKNTHGSKLVSKIGDTKMFRVQIPEYSAIISPYSLISSSLCSYWNVEDFLVAISLEVWVQNMAATTCKGLGVGCHQKENKLIHLLIDFLENLRVLDPLSFQ